MEPQHTRALEALGYILIGLVGGWFTSEVFYRVVGPVIDRVRAKRERRRARRREAEQVAFLRDQWQTHIREQSRSRNDTEG